MRLQRRLNRLEQVKRPDRTDEPAQAMLREQARQEILRVVAKHKARQAEIQRAQASSDPLERAWAAKQLQPSEERTDRTGPDELMTLLNHVIEYRASRLTLANRPSQKGPTNFG